MHWRQTRTAAIVVALVIGNCSWVIAGNPTVYTRYLQTGPTYGPHHHRGYQDCMMPWQPIRSVMHYNVLPPGMHRPPPLWRPNPWLSPRTPSFAGGMPTGCGFDCGTSDVRYLSHVGAWGGWGVW